MYKLKSKTHSTVIPVGCETIKLLPVSPFIASVNIFKLIATHTKPKIALTGSQSTSDALGTEMKQAFTIDSRKQFFYTHTLCFEVKGSV